MNIILNNVKTCHVCESSIMNFISKCSPIILDCTVINKYLFGYLNEGNDGNENYKFVIIPVYDNIYLFVFVLVKE